MSKKITSTQMYKLLVVLLTLGIVGMQFLPFWAFGEETVSVFSFSWGAENYSELYNYFNAHTGKTLSFNEIILIPNLQCITAVLMLAVFLLKPKTVFTPILSAIIGLMGVVMFLSKDIYRLGAFWYIHMICNLIVVIISAFCIYLHFRNRKKRN